MKNLPNLKQAWDNRNRVIVLIFTFMILILYLAAIINNEFSILIFYENILNNSRPCVSS